jgi:hypothetical protein
MPEGRRRLQKGRGLFRFQIQLARSDAAGPPNQSQIGTVSRDLFQPIGERRHLLATAGLSLCLWNSPRRCTR